MVSTLRRNVPTRSAYSQVNTPSHGHAYVHVYKHTQHSLLEMYHRKGVYALKNDVKERKVFLVEDTTMVQMAVVCLNVRDSVLEVLSGTRRNRTSAWNSGYMDQTLFTF